MKKKAWINLLIFAFIFIALVEIASTYHPAIQSLKEVIDPVGDVMGIWQGSWDLFAPHVDRENHRIVAEVSLAGTDKKIYWESPDWNQVNCFKKFCLSREIEYFDRVRAPEKRVALSSMGTFLKEKLEAESPTETISRIEIGQKTWRIPIRGAKESDFSTTHLITLTFPPNGDADHKGLE